MAQAGDRLTVGQRTQGQMTNCPEACRWPLPEPARKTPRSTCPSLGKWLEVRSRYLTWVDGRLAQMVIATDITARRLAEEQAAQQAERAQAASRLITMGEMASSVAHELNQPLTAINNYCSGMVSRIQTAAPSTRKPMRCRALQKTAHQAQRAGQIIQRIRAFVKTQRTQPHAGRRARHGGRSRWSWPTLSCAATTCA